jgi:hypothetical protein
VTSFADACMKWAEQTEERLQAVFRRSVELLADELIKTQANGGRLPHRTGNLMRSLVAQIGSMPSQGSPDDRYSGSDVGAITAQALLGDDVFLGFQANYARRMNYGFVGQDSLGRTYNQTGAGFVEYARDAWPLIVKQAAEEIRQGVDGGQ